MRIFKNKQNKEEVVVESTKNLETPVVTEKKNKEEKKSTTRLSDILDMAKNIDANKLQDSISSVQKAIGLIGDMFIKDKGTDTNAYTPRPIYRKFDD